MFNTPIIYIAYNRINTVKKTFSIIKKLKPQKLLVILDGPKNLEDKKNCIKVKKYIKKNIKWKVKKIFIESKNNKGLKKNIIGGLNKAFRIYSKAIIIEDDCLLDLSFFKFCEQLLTFHKNDKKIWGITSQTFLKSKKSDYFYSKYAHCWGWATWSDRWKKFDKKMSFWPQWKKSSHWKNLFDYELEKKYWEYIYNKTYFNHIKSWNYIWQAFVWRHNGLIATPYKNLVQNIGFGADSTNTKYKNRNLIRKVYEIKHVKNNNNFIINKCNDKYVFFNIYFSNKFFLKNFSIYYLLYIILNPKFLFDKTLKYLSKKK
jgi:hypothetical protein